MSLAEQIKNSIQQVLGDAEVYIKSADDKHFEGIVISPRFNEKSLVEQHRLVMNALSSLFDRALHAFQLKTYTPKQWAHEKEKKLI